MSQTIRLRRAHLALVALLSSAALLLLAPPRGEAAFSGSYANPCSGSNIIGRGASFARDAHSLWKIQFGNVYCASAGTTPDVTYEAQGSGAGRRAMGERTGSNADGSQSRTQAPRFGMSDEPPTPNRVNEMNKGAGPLDSNTGDEGSIHVVPAAVGAVAMAVNFPDNCDPALLNPENRTIAFTGAGGAPTSSERQLVRVRFDKTKFEKAWASDADADSWTEVFPELAPDADCNKAITRVVRFDDSGTTFAFKDYLDRLNPARDWLPGYQAGTGDTRKWPNDGSPPPGILPGARADCGGATGPGPAPDGDQPGPPVVPGDNLTSGCANGNGPLVEKLKSTDGSIGYSDVSTARGAGLAIEPGTNDNDTYWTQAQNGSDQFTEPTSDPNGYRTDGNKGSNCAQTTFTVNAGTFPASTFDDWSQVSGVNSPQGFGVCTLTYGLVFDDNAPVWGNNVTEEAKARTVKDYWLNVVSNAGQNILPSNDYSPLPPAILSIARAGVNRVDWNKAGSGGGGGGTGGGSTGGGTTGGGSTGGGAGSTPPPAQPSNRFSISRVALNSRRGLITVSIRVPGRGLIHVAGTGKIPRTRSVGRVRRTVTRAGTYKVTLKLNRAARRTLRRRGALKVRLKVSFRPTGGSARSTTRTVTLRIRRARR